MPTTDLADVIARWRAIAMMAAATDNKNTSAIELALILDAAEAGMRARDAALEEAANAATDGHLRGFGRQAASLYDQGRIDAARRIRALKEKP